MINFYLCNFPNLYEKYKNFLEKNNLKFIFRNTSEIKHLKNDFTTGATTEAYFKNNDSKNENFSININEYQFVENIKGYDSSSFLKVVSTVIHEMLHFITLTINYDILKEQETLEKSYKNRELCFIYFLYGKNKLNDEDKEEFEERLKLLKKSNSEIYFNKSYCQMGAYELPNICLTDFFMNNIVKNMIEFINEIEVPAYFRRKHILISHFKSLTKQIYDSGKNKKYTIEIGEKILNFFKNYDNNLAGNVFDNSNNDSDDDDDDSNNDSDDEKLKIDDFYSEDEDEEDEEDEDSEEDDNEDTK